MRWHRRLGVLVVGLGAVLLMQPSTAAAWPQSALERAETGAEQRNMQSLSKTGNKSDPQPSPEAAAPDPIGGTVKSEGEFTETRLGISLFNNLAQDQKAIWTSPAHVRFEDTAWLVPIAGMTAGLLVTDRQFSKHLSNAPNTLKRYRNISDYGIYSMVGAAGGLYLWGNLIHDEHRRETGILAGEAALNSLALTTAVKYTARRSRPLEAGGLGEFGHGGTSFPSEHAAAAWSVAGVIAHEYPGLLTKVLAYGMASAVSVSRVKAKEHFPSDVLIGSAIGWFVGQHVYRAHHDPELGGSGWEGLTHASLREGARNPRSWGSPYVPLDGWIYPALERLAALGYISTGFVGSRPWTRRECARLVSEAEDQIDVEAQGADGAYELLTALKQEFQDELSGTGNVRFRIESVYTRVTGISGKPLTDSYDFGQTLINDYGRPYQEGFNNVSGFSAWATAGPWVGYVRGEYQHAPSAPALPLQARQLISHLDGLPVLAPGTPVPSADQFRLLDAYVGLNLKNWQMTFGNQSLSWGPGAGGSMTISNNVEPINMFRVNRVTPIKLPSILGWLGPMRTEFFLGQLAGQEFIFSPLGFVGQFGRALDPQPFIHGQKISFKPTPNFEFEFFRTTIYGGPGYPFTWHTFIRSLVSTGNTVFGNPSKPGKRTSGLDFTYRLPGLRRWLTFYGDGLAYDEFSPIAYADRSIWRAGLYLSHFPVIPKLDLRTEGVYSDNPLAGNLCCGFYYRNATWRSGYTNDGNLIGSWIGRDGQGAQAWSTYHFSPKNSLEITFRHLKVSQQYLPNGGTLTDFGVRGEYWIRPDLGVSGIVQREKWLYPVIARGAQTNLTTSFQVTFQPGRWNLSGRNRAQ